MNSDLRDLDDPTKPPSPDGGWSQSLTQVQGAYVIAPTESAMVQEAGLLDASGAYVPQGALWRRHRALTIEPDRPGADAPLEEISGRWLWGGVLWAHFGHFLTESTSRLWALAHLDEPVDGVLFMPKRPAVGDQIRGFHRDFISMMRPDLPIRVLAAPARVETLIVPGQGFGLGDITRATAQYRNAIHAMFARDIAPEGAGKIYISRSRLGLGKGGLLGEERMEELLAAEGYEIFHPQDHTLMQQIARYKAARQVIAADGSALHLFAMVGRPDQQVAVVLRRRSAAHTLLTDNIRAFCHREPLSIGALRTEWVPIDDQKSSRRSFGELDHAAIGLALQAGGFIRNGQNWPVLSDRERRGLLREKGIKSDRFVESPEFLRARIREIRQDRRKRRALRAARDQQNQNTVD